ncbi:UDP-N-acetylmuramoyl-L-alanine--D-glutamate ligase [Roseimarinus sediminis]|uniref:UDP-N-acetylmuramoyl-L-alanine--D-glutamate ligase n=1 Tax=Roseimarinus sediminis TaxID=1610899 RepID=UPI003D2586C4
MKKRLVILGAGESGVGAAILGKARDYEVWVSDKGSIRPDYRNELLKHELAFEEGLHSHEKIMNADLIVKSPGIPDNIPLIQQIKEKHIKVISEIEFASWFTSAVIIGITGSNGKTTTTLMVYDLLKRAGIKAGLAGNVGRSFARQVALENFTHYVIELSSFQLDGMFDFRAHIAVLMNITPDHLDRYDYNMQKYIDSKFRIIQNQTGDDVFIYFQDDENISREVKSRVIPSRKIPFSLGQLDIEEGAWARDGQISVNYNENKFDMSIYDLALQGRHNTCNSMAAAIVGKVAGIRNAYIRDCLSGFSGVEHRLEKYLTVHGIEFINDSKATNINSSWYALESMTRPCIWIVGGIDKGNNYEELADLVKNKVKAIVCLGKDNTRILAAFKNIVPDIFETESMEHAVKSAYFVAEKGDVVLLSPACASFDLFENYEDRGRQFKEAVRNL